MCANYRNHTRAGKKIEKCNPILLSKCYLFLNRGMQNVQNSMLWNMHKKGNSK